MASGKGHDSFNSIVGIFIFAYLSFFYDVTISISFFFGFMFSTLFFSPDLDLGPKKRVGPARILLYPYSLFFKHRGVSHSIILGTLTRIIYAVIVFIILSFLLNRLGYLTIGEGEVIKSLVIFVKKYNYSLQEYKISTWVFVGMFFADFLHVLVDKLTSSWKALLR